MSCLLWPILRNQISRDGSDSASLNIRVTIDGVTETLPFPTLTANRWYWLSGDQQTDADGGVGGRGDLVRALFSTCLGSHSQFAAASLTVTLSETNRVTVAVAGGHTVALLWGNAATTVLSTVFGWAQSDTAAVLSLAAPNQTIGAWTPSKTDGTGWPPSDDSREIEQRVTSGAVAISGVSRVSYLGLAAATRDLAWALLPNRYALNEYADATEPTGTAEDAWGYVMQGRPIRFYENRATRTSTSYALYLLRAEDIRPGRDAAIRRDDRFRLRWIFSLPLRVAVLSAAFFMGSGSIPAAASSVRVNGSTVSDPNFTDGTPAPPAGYLNVAWQWSGSSISAYWDPSQIPLNSDAAVDNRRRPQAGLGRHWYGLRMPEQTVVGGFGILGAGAFTVGTISFPALASTNYRTSTIVERRTSATSANSRIFSLSSGNAGTTVGQVWRGNAAGLGGFFAQFRWGFSTTLSTQACFMGMIDGSIGAAWAGSVDPSSQVNLFGVGADTGDTNLFLMHNDGSGTCTRIDLGGNFLKATTSTIWCLEFYCASNGSGIDYYIRDEVSGNTASGTISSDIPANTLFLSNFYYMSNRGSGTPGAIAHDMASIYLETLQGAVPA